MITIKECLHEGDTDASWFCLERTTENFWAAGTG